MHRKSEVDYISYFYTVQTYKLERISVLTAANSMYIDFKGTKGNLVTNLNWGPKSCTCESVQNVDE